MNDDHENALRRKRQHGRQWSRVSRRNTSVIPNRSGAEIQNENDENNGDETVDESGAVDTVPSASTGGRFKRPDFVLQGLITRAKNRVRDRNGRGEKGDEDVSQVLILKCCCPSKHPLRQYINSSVMTAN